MKTKYYLIFIAVLFIIGIIVIFFSPWSLEQRQIVVLNLILIILRGPFLRMLPYILRKRVIRGIVSSLYNISIIVFAFWLLFLFSAETFIAVFSFFVISISLTFKSFITNAVSGAIMLTSGQFDIGDLIETNNVQGIVKDITLNYTEIQEFDGVPVIIPNSNMYGSILTKFTHKKFLQIDPPKPGASERKVLRYRKYIKYLNKMLSAQPKTTKYVKQVQIQKSVDPEKLDIYLKPIFDKYQDIFDMRPDYVVDTTLVGRCRINLYVSAKRPELIVNNIDAFLRDIVFQLYNKEIYQGWERYRKPIKSSTNKKAEAKK